jgi:hypothetical protein
MSAGMAAAVSITAPSPGPYPSTGRCSSGLTGKTRLRERSYGIARHNPLVKIWGRFVEKRLVDSDFFDEGVSEDLLYLNEGYGLVKIFVTIDSPLNGHTLFESNTPIMISGL